MRGKGLADGKAIVLTGTGLTRDEVETLLERRMI